MNKNFYSYVKTMQDPFCVEESQEIQTQYVHIRMLQRRGRKCWTLIEGLDSRFDYMKILRCLRKDLCCNGTLIQDEELGTVIQLQGDSRKSVAFFLIEEGIVDKSLVRIHGT